MQHRDEDWFLDDFKSGLMLSIALHIFLLIIAFIVARILVPSTPKDAALEILKASVRVDVVGMPKMTIQELKALQAEMPKATPEVAPVKETKTEAAEAPPKPDDVVMPEASKAKKSLSEMLASYSQKKAPIAKKDQRGDKRAAKTDGLDSLILEGNRLSKGTALVGDVSDTADAPLVAYAESMLEKIRSNWRLPSFLKDKNLQCRIHVWVSGNGQLIKAEMRESSGNSDYDSKAMGAIRAAAPFSAPEPAVGDKMSQKGIVIGFPL